MRDFTDKVAAITGAGSGIGRALAQNLAAKGCHLALSDVNSEGLAETARLCETSGLKVTTAVLDVADRAAVFAWAEQVVAEHGRVNLIFNNAGVAHSTPAETARIEDFEWVMSINFWGVVHGTQAFLPHLRASGGGHVINLSSLFGLIAVPTQSTYNASKFAVRGFTEALRMELEMAQAPVSVTCVHPGGVATQIADSARVDPGVTALTGDSPEQARANARKAIQATTPAAAAQQILSGVQRNDRRVLVGPDARWLDRLQRLLGSGAYQPALKWALSKRKAST